jgi:thymidylate synthase (FAD)
MELNIIEQSATVTRISPKSVFKEIASAAAKSRLSTPNDEELTHKLWGWQHMVPFEFIDIRADLVANIGVSRELLRHRLVSAVEQSTRYTAKKALEGKGLTVIRPHWWGDADEGRRVKWVLTMKAAYKYLKAFPEMPNDELRDVLPLATATQLAVKANLREWLAIFKLRTAKNAHPQIRQLMSFIIWSMKAQNNEVATILELAGY